MITAHKHTKSHIDSHNGNFPLSRSQGLYPDLRTRLAGTASHRRKDLGTILAISSNSAGMLLQPYK